MGSCNGDLLTLTDDGRCLSVPNVGVCEGNFKVVDGVCILREHGIG